MLLFPADDRLLVEGATPSSTSAATEEENKHPSEAGYRESTHAYADFSHEILFSAREVRIFSLYD